MEDFFVGVIGDKPDHLGIDYELMGAEVDIPSKYIMNDNYVQDQGLTQETKYMCTAYSNTSGANEILHKRGNPNKYNGRTLGMYMVELGLLDLTAGAYIIDAVKTSKQLGYINGYTTVKTLEQIKSAIANDRPVMVGSNQINRKETLKAPYIAIKGNSYGHAFFVSGYDDENKILICENSYGTKFDNGRFYIKYEDIDLLFNSKFAIYINDSNFNILNGLIKEAKRWGYKDFYDLYLKGKEGKQRMLAELANQLVFLKKVNNKKLLELIK